MLKIEGKPIPEKITTTLLLIILTIIYPHLGWTQSQEAPKAFQKFIVYKDKGSFNRFTMSGFMPSGKCEQMDDAWITDCHEGKSCIKAYFDRDCSILSGGDGWAGVYWLHPANNWGDKKGSNLTGAAKLTFWAKGENGDEVLTFQMGGVGMRRDHPDTTNVKTELITLTKDWKQYSIDLKDRDLSNISGGFAWVGSAKQNQQNITFYLDDIAYE